MSPIIKLLIGVVLLVLPLALYAYDFVTPDTLPFGFRPLNSLWVVVQGTVPPFVALIGLFVVWLELDEWRIERELKKEEGKEEEGKKKRGRKKKK